VTVGSEMGPLKIYPPSLHLAEVLAAEGRIGESRVLSEQALDISQQFHDQQGIGLSEAALAHVFALEGKFSDAVARYNDAIAILRGIHDPMALGSTLLDLGDAQVEQGNLAAARKRYEEARTLTVPLPGLLRPEIEMAFARLSLDGGDATDAAAHARAAMDSFNAAVRQGDRLEAATILLRALVARGSIDEASGVLGQIPSAEAKALPVEAVVHFRIARSLVLANTSSRSEAIRSLDTIAAEVVHLGLPPLQKEARLAREALVKAPLTHTAFAR